MRAMYEIQITEPGCDCDDVFGVEDMAAVPAVGDVICGDMQVVAIREVDAYMEVATVEIEFI